MLNLQNIDINIERLDNRSLEQVLASIQQNLQMAEDSAYSYSEQIGKGANLNNCTIKLSVNRQALVPFMIDKGYMLETRVPASANTHGQSYIKAPTPISPYKYEFYHALGKALTHYALFNLHQPVVGAYIATGLVQPTAYIFTNPAKSNDDSSQAPTIELTPHYHKQHHSNQQEQAKEQQKPTMAQQEADFNRQRLRNAIKQQVATEDDDKEQDKQRTKRRQQHQRDQNTQHRKDRQQRQVKTAQNDYETFKRQFDAQQEAKLAKIKLPPRSNNKTKQKDNGLSR